MNMTTLKTLVATSLSLVCLASLRAEITGQWDFESDLSATVGNDLEYFDDVDGPTEQETKFGTTATFGVPGIDGAVASVMKTAKNSSSMGYLIRPDLPGKNASTNTTVMVILETSCGAMDMHPRPSEARLIGKRNGT